MNRPNLRLVVALASLLVSGVSAMQSVPASGFGLSPVASIDRVLSDAVARHDIPGVVAIVADRRGILYRGAFGVADVASGRPLTGEAIFRIASMTKPVTSVAAMQLVEQGKLRLDDPAEKYLPEFANLKVFDRFDARTGTYTVRPAATTVTVRHLLTHTSGLGYNFTSAVVRDFKPRDGDQFPVGPLLFEPGEKWLYGPNIDWVGRLVESLSSQTLEAYFRDHVFKPLRMTDTFFNVPGDRLPRLSPVHRRRPDGMFEVDPTQPPTSVTRFNGGGGLSSTAADYIRFLRMFLNQGTLDGVRVLSGSTIDQMGRNHIGSVGVRALETAMPARSSDFTFVADGRDKWGIGFLIAADQVRGRRSAGSLSWGGINNTYFWVDSRRGIAGVILMQYLPFADSKALATYEAFERAVYQLPAVSKE